ncbi:MAG: hypothetical protein HY870_09425 [Chloroflexi bacterium]|nr:hypothetical protein [Chloroflexota bacterium]
MERTELKQVVVLFQEWHRLGGNVLVVETNPDLPERSAEAVLAESTAYCRDSGRLTWVTLDWLVRHIDQLDVERLLQAMTTAGDWPVLGVLSDAAYARQPHPRLKQIMRVCRRSEVVEPFFRRVARSPLALKLTRENALDVFRRWNYLCSELRYL